MSVNPLISVIVPVFNAEKFIQKCIISVLEQTYHNIEILVINDGSTDDTSTIVSGLSSRDTRIKLVTVPNGGVSNARNIGLSLARGDYVAFLDSDDWIDAKMIETLYNLCFEYKAEVAMCGRTNIRQGVCEPLIKGEPIHFYDGVINIERLSSQYDLNVAWNKLYRRCLFDGVTFPSDMSYGEDLYAVIDIVAKTKHIVYIPDGLYYYVENFSSASYGLSDEKLQSDIKAKTKLLNYTKRKGADITIPFDFLFGAYVKAYAYGSDKMNIKTAYNRYFFHNMKDAVKHVKCILFLIWPSLYYRLKFKSK